MDKGKHTPGPWKVVANTHFHSGLTYVSVQPETPDAETMRPLLMASGEYHVCRMTHTAAHHAIALHVANARLIAAAPDLLKALQELQSFVIIMVSRGPDAAIPETVPTPLGPPIKVGAIMRDAAAVIAKASA